MTSCKPRVLAHDEVGIDLFPPQAIQQRFLIRLGCRLHGRHLAEPPIVFQGHREWLDEGLEQASVRIIEGRAGLSHEYNDAGWVLRVAEWPCHDVGRNSRRNDHRQKFIAGANCVLV